MDHGYGHKLTDSNYSLVGYFLLVGFYRYWLVFIHLKFVKINKSRLNVMVILPSFGEPLDSLERSGKNIP